MTSNAIISMKLLLTLCTSEMSMLRVPSSLQIRFTRSCRSLRTEVWWSPCEWIFQRRKRSKTCSSSSSKPSTLTKIEKSSHLWSSLPRTFAMVQESSEDCWSHQKPPQILSKLLSGRVFFYSLDLLSEMDWPPQPPLFSLSLKVIYRTPLAKKGCSLATFLAYKGYKFIDILWKT